MRERGALRDYTVHPAPHPRLPPLSFPPSPPPCSPTSSQVPCRGKGQSPQAEAVNKAVYEIWRYVSYNPDRFVLVHCTHGFNRTGFIIACALVRLKSEIGMTLERAVRKFAEGRPPGIYKDGGERAGNRNLGGG
jgi:hypothetical protein